MTTPGTPEWAAECAELGCHDTGDDYELGREHERDLVLAWLRFWHPNTAFEIAGKIEAGEHRHGRHVPPHLNGEVVL